MIVPGPVFTEDGVKDWQPPPPMQDDFRLTIGLGFDFYRANLR
jgi:hypothetical protein